MASKIAAVVAAVDTIIKANITIANTETTPVNKTQGNFFAITFEDAGKFQGRSAGWGQSFHAVSSFIMGPHSNMRQTFETLEGECEEIALDILADETLGGTCDTLGDVTYAMANLEQGGIKYTGYKLTVSEIKIARTY